MVIKVASNSPDFSVVADSLFAHDGLYSWMILVYSVDYATITLKLCKQKNALCFITINNLRGNSII